MKKRMSSKQPRTTRRIAWEASWRELLLLHMMKTTDISTNQSSKSLHQQSRNSRGEELTKLLALLPKRKQVDLSSGNQNSVFKSQPHHD